MGNSDEENSLTLDKKTADVLVVPIIPTSKYFEAPFDHMQAQIDGLKDSLKASRSDVDKRFENVDKRFEPISAGIPMLSSATASAPNACRSTIRSFLIRRKKK